MALLPIPSPVGPWKKVLIYVKDTVVSGVSYLAYEYGAEMEAAGEEPGDQPASTWRKFTLKYENTISSAPADDQYLAIELVNLTDGQIDGTWTEGDYNAVMGIMGTLVDTLAPYVAGYLTCTELAAYARGYAPYSTYTPGQYYKHFVDSGPPVFVHSWTKPGTGSTSSAPQVCTTITEMTATRKHWGRNYMPTLAAGAITSGGRLATADATIIINAWAGAYTQLANADYMPVVPTTMANKVPAHTLQGISGVRIDDTLDIQRRRRHRHAVTVITLPTE